MEQLIPVLMIVGMVAFVMIKQIGKLTQRLDRAQASQAFSRYAKFSAIIQEHVREIKQSLDSSKSVQERPFVLIDAAKEVEALEKLSDVIRKLVFFETMSARQKSADEIEAELFELLNGLENFLKEYCQDGEALSDHLRESLLHAYEALYEEEEEVS
jgi:D-aminopeptidase